MYISRIGFNVFRTLFSDAVVVLQVQMNVAEASSGNVIAGVAVAAMAVGGALILAFDAMSLKASAILLAKNIRTIRSC